ncbi:MAG: PQQ-dependent sugar dehydrogenase, partial [Miltoncostaeaceae bacterium]
MRLSAAIAIAASCALGATATASALGQRTVGRGFDSPVGVVQAPGESRLLVVERRGVVRPIVRGRPGAPWLDIRGRVGTRGLEQGLLGIAFRPDFARSGRFYVNYTDRSGATRVVEFRTRRGARRVSTHTART